MLVLALSDAHIPDRAIVCEFGTFVSICFLS